MSLNKYNNEIRKILKNRGVTEEDLEVITSPHSYILPNTEKAVELFIDEMIKNSIFGYLLDVDCDGIASGKIIIEYTRRLGIPYKYTMNSRKEHGITEETIQWVRENKIKCLIVPDAGTNDTYYHKVLEEMGVKLIILDHHRIEKETSTIPTNNIVIVNSTHEDSQNKYLSGCGVTFRFLMELEKRLGTGSIDILKLWVGLSVLSDSCNMLDKENRHYVQYLFDNYDKDSLFNKFTNYGSLNNMFCFTIIPILNACIRMGDREIIYKLAFEKYDKSVIKYIDQAQELHQKQKELVDMAMRDIKILPSKHVIVARLDDDRYKDILGLIANKILSDNKKAVLLLMKKEDRSYSGSFRGNNSVNSDDLEACGIRTAGHKKACGIFIDSEEDFKIKIKDILTKDFEELKELEYEMAVPEINYSEYYRTLFQIAIINELTGKEFNPIKVKIMDITREPEVLNFDKVRRYKHIRFEVVEFDMDKNYHEEKIKTSVIVSPCLNGSGFTLVKDR